MKQFKSRKNQPRWTKTMSILSLSVALQTQACAGTKVEMMRTSFPLSNDGFQEAFQKAVSSMEYFKYIKIIPSTYAAAFFQKEANGNNGLHRLAEREGNLLEFEMVLMALKKASKENNREPKEIIGEMLRQQNEAGYSVLTATLLPLIRRINVFNWFQDNRRKKENYFRGVLDLINGYLTRIRD